MEHPLSPVKMQAEKVRFSRTTPSSCKGSLNTLIARYRDFFYTSLGWFDWPEPSLTTSLQGIEGVQGAPCTSWMRFKHSVQRTSSNLIKLHPHRDSKVARLLLYEFGVVRLDRTFSDYIFTGDRRSEGCSMH